MWHSIIIVSFLSLVCAFSETESNEDRIVGGSATSIHQIPYMVALQNGDWNFCGGALISPTIVLTASHCLIKSNLNPKKTDGLTVRLGSTYKNKGGTVKGVETFLTHPKYNATTDENDVALIKLSSEVIESSVIKIIKVATSLPEEDTPCTVSGWGRTKEGVNQYQDVLQSAVVSYVSTERCRGNDFYYGRSFIKDAEICGKAEKKGVCQGDSGGPMVNEDDLTVIGVVSHSVGCALDFYPNVYANVPMFADWILENSKTL